MNVFVFPGQGSQFPGMGKELYSNSKSAKELFDKADQILGLSCRSSQFGISSRLPTGNRSPQDLQVSPLGS